METLVDRTGEYGKDRKKTNYQLPFSNQKSKIGINPTC
ncbi:hypothetical protein GXM_04978 [Nostoc sphaeroides CCNUC1]|uniref:Uncharacterized protein n=1 Tax=Nostoc sphaeroides CCNUC1 TaxID=2653204 RepID=A0A5P8W5D0_9NOSO|nr:hypothetical protein GXM_04978 [Nostoc sphaeroides CCNUC1]